MDKRARLLIDHAIEAMATGTDGEAVTTIVTLFEFKERDVLEVLVGKVLSIAGDGELEALTVAAQDPAGRLPSDETLAAVVAAIRNGDLECLMALTRGTYDDLLVLLIGCLARLTTVGSQGDAVN